MERLKAGEILFVTSPAAESSLVTATVNTDIEDHSEHESESTHVHDQREGGQDAESEKHGHHEEHHGGNGHGRHSDFKAEYHFVCKQPRKIARMDVMLFSKFPGIDSVELMAKIKLIQTSIVESLNGQRVRIPGCLLPLETSGTRVTEFLLVLYIDACMCVPPPNQIIHVKIAQKEG